MKRLTQIESERKVKAYLESQGLSLSPNKQEQKQENQPSETKGNASKNTGNASKSSYDTIDGEGKVPLYAYRPIVLCTDNQGILDSVETSKNLLKDIERLARILGDADYEKALNQITECEKEIKKLKDKIEISRYELHIKSLTLVVCHIVYSSCKQVLEKTGKKELKLAGLAEDMRGVKFGVDLSKTDPKSLIVDLEVVLEDLKEFVPELKIKLSKKTEIIQPKLFQESNVTKTSTSLVTDTVFNLFVSRSISFEKVSEKLTMSMMSYTTGAVSIIQEKEKAKKAIIEGIVDNYGEDTFKVFQALGSYWYHSATPEAITVSGNDILDILNKKYERSDRNRKRIKKVYNLQWLAHQCILIDGLKVYSTRINPSNGAGFPIERTPLIEFPRMSFTPHHIDLYSIYRDNVDLSEITDLRIKFKLGDWFDFFNDPKYCVQFGFTHAKAFSSNGMLSNFLHWITIKSRQNQKGDFKIQTVLEGLGYKEEIEEILTSKGSGYKAKDLFNAFNTMIKEAQSIEDLPQKITYTLPQWEGRKPNGWFQLWLNKTINIKETRLIQAHIDVEAKKPSPKPSTKNLTPTDKELNPTNNDNEPLTVQGLKDLLEEYKDHPNVSLRKLAQAYGSNRTTLTRKIKNNKLTKTEIRDLTNLILILSKKRI